MNRAIYEAEHETYRLSVRKFFENEVVPHYPRWEEQRLIDREIYRRAAELGIYALEIPEEFGGSGETDYRYRMVVCEESARVHTTSLNVTFGLFDDIILSYLLNLTTDQQKHRWLRDIATGEKIAAIAMTEPSAGSDLRGIRTTARRDGDYWVLNGSKTFISCASSADIVIVAARTGPGRSDFSLFVVERGMRGFAHGRTLNKIGLHAQDTGELFFDDVQIPAENLLGTENQGLAHLMANLPKERISIVAQSYSTARSILDETIRYAKERVTFDKALIDHQHVKFTLAEMATELDVAEAYVDRSVLALNRGELTPVDAAKGKWYLSELLTKVVDKCVQIHGGYGYMLDYPVARAFVDSRVQTIYGGTTEIMKEIIGRNL